MTPDDELALRIGRIARAHVAIDSSLRRVYVTLASPGLATFLANNNPSTEALVRDCRWMLAKAEIDTEFRDAANRALAAATAANETRNRVVHDMWMVDMTAVEQADPRMWRTYRIARGQLGGEPSAPRDLAYLDDTLETMRRTDLRLVALNWALWSVLPSYRGAFAGDVERDAERAKWTRVMDDRSTFTPGEGGGFRLLGAEEG